MDYIMPVDATTPYGKLVESMQVYLNRYDEDTLAKIPLFINTAEKLILRKLRVPFMEKMVVFTLQDAGDNDLPVVEGLSQPNDWVRCPSDLLEPKFLWTDEVTLKRVPFDRYLIIKRQIKDGSYPDCEPAWALNAGRLFIIGVEQDTEVFMTYYSDLAELSASSECSPLLQIMPDALLYVAVGEGFKFLMEEERGRMWVEDGLARVMEVQDQADEAEFAGGPLVIERNGYESVAPTEVSKYGVWYGYR